mmetsp:Transcript_29124/g.32691  ORF Transcript_29124/g.32691 Transcript_29124/m.32691 type:complete len:901 (-) Transcript_29124:137-2839(-)
MRFSIITNNPLLLFLSNFILLWPVAMVTSRGILHKEGFIEELVASERSFTGAFIPNPTSPDTKPPMLLLSSKRGIVNVMVNPDESTATKKIMDIEYTLCTNGERGMQSIVPHPNFTENNYIYIFYTAIAPGCLEDAVFGPRNRLSRFKMDPQTFRIRNETEEVLMEGAPTHRFYHNGGAIKFGNDGKIYVTTGDAGGDGKGTSQDMTNLHGSLLRLNDDGTVPLDNPFTFQGGYNGIPCGQNDGILPSDAPPNAVCSEIFSYGFRNPFRIIMDPGETEKTRFYVNDVGGAVWEEISEAGTDFPRKNYGWPTYEGPCKFGQTEDCPLFNPNSNVQSRESYQLPLYYYEHEQEREGGAITGGAFVPEGIWPAEFKYIYADFIFHSIFNLVEAPEDECSTCLPPIPSYKNDTFYTSLKNEGQHANYARVVDIFFGPYKDTQALYIFKMGGTNNVWRIRYTGSDNIPPVANIEVLTSSVDVGDIVAFSGSDSYDADDLILQYEWDFGDNESFSREENPIHIYPASGQYTVRLAVTDSANHTQTTSVVMVVGTPPILNITSPVIGDGFFVGEILTLSGVAYNSSGGPLNDDQISWEVRKHHADHWHPFLDEKTGNNMQLFPAPEPEDYLAATNSYLEIIMYATDLNGLVSTSTRNVYPRLVEVCVDSEPQGLEVYVDEYPITTPLRITSWVNHELRLRTTTNQDLHTFSSWSDGIVTNDREIRLRDGTNPGVVASFCVGGNNTCISEARVRAASDTVVAPRCLTDSPTAGPTVTVSGSPTSLSSASPSDRPSKAPSRAVSGGISTVVETNLPTMDPEEDWPVDITIVADKNQEYDELDEPSIKEGPVHERPVDDLNKIDPDDQELWNLFEEEEKTIVDSAGSIYNSKRLIFTLYSLVLTILLVQI